MFVSWRNDRKFVPVNDNTECNFKPYNVKNYIKINNSKRVKEYSPYICFIDLETSGLIMDVVNIEERRLYSKIPEIKEISMLVFKTYNFLHEPELCKPVEINTLTSGKYITLDALCLFQSINNLYNPIFIAHNGYTFDFFIILTLLYGNNINITRSLKFYDSLSFARDSGHFKSCKNVDIFKLFLPRYANYANLIHQAHTAEADALMTALWMHQMKHLIDLNEYKTKEELCDNYQNMYKRTLSVKKPTFFKRFLK